MSWLDVAVIGWFLASIVLLVLQQFETRASRVARLALAPIAVGLFIAAVWNFGAVFGPMISAGQG